MKEIRAFRKIEPKNVFDGLDVFRSVTRTIHVIESVTQTWHLCDNVWQPKTNKLIRLWFYPRTFLSRNGSIPAGPFTSGAVVVQWYLLPVMNYIVLSHILWFLSYGDILTFGKWLSKALSFNFTAINLTFQNTLIDLSILRLLKNWTPPSVWLKLVLLIRVKVTMRDSINI